MLHRTLKRPALSAELLVDPQRAIPLNLVDRQSGSAASSSRISANSVGPRALWRSSRQTMSQVASSPSMSAWSNAPRSAGYARRRDHDHALVSASSVKSCGRPAAASPRRHPASDPRSRAGRAARDVNGRSPRAVPHGRCRSSAGAELVRCLLDEIHVEVDVRAPDHTQTIHPATGARYTSLPAFTRGARIRCADQRDRCLPGDSPAGRAEREDAWCVRVIGLVAAFSLSSTLVKRAETPGVLVAFWRMLMVAKRPSA